MQQLSEYKSLELVQYGSWLELTAIPGTKIYADLMQSKES